MSKQTQQIERMGFNAINGLRELVESNIFVKDDGYRHIKIPNSHLDFSAEFLYLEFIKAENPKFEEIISSGSNEIKIQKRIEKFDGMYLSVMGGLFLKSIDEMRRESS